MLEGGEKFVNDEEKKTQEVGEGSNMKNHTLCSEKKGRRGCINKEREDYMM